MLVNSFKQLNKKGGMNIQQKPKKCLSVGGIGLGCTVVPYAVYKTYKYNKYVRTYFQIYWE